MFGIRVVFLLLLVTNVLVNGYQDDGNLDGELEVLLKRLQERLEDEERGFELQDLFERESLPGIRIDADAVAIFADFWSPRGNTKWAIFKIEKKREIVFDDSDTPQHISQDKDQFNELKRRLTSEPRYILYDFNFIDRDGREIQQIVFIFWCPDGASREDKMLYRAAKNIITKTLSNIRLEFEANYKYDLDYETYKAEMREWLKNQNAVPAQSI